MILNIFPYQLTETFVTIMVGASLICFLTSELTSNYSQVDKVWSLMPIIYSLIALVRYPSPRLCIMTALGLRLYPDYTDYIKEVPKFLPRFFN